MRLKPLVAIGAGVLLIPVVVTLAARRDATGGPSADSAAPTTSVRAERRKAAEPQTYASLLVDLDRRIAGVQQQVEKRDRDWLARGQLATVLLERASLTNQIDDFERAVKAVDDAFGVAPKRSGPFEVGVRVNFTIHRLDEADKYISMVEERAIPKKEDRAFVTLARAQIAMQRGDYGAAFEGFSLVGSAQRELTTPELALYYAKTGEPAQAESLLLDALESTDPARDPRRRAWLRLQYARIAMDAGKYREALTRLDEADKELPGWWQIDEQRAEAHGALGDNAEALAIYEKLVQRTRLPQIIDSLAAAYQHAGRKEEAQKLIDEAEALWKDHMKRLPEAAMGHGLFHYLQFGPPDKALELALANYAARPGLESPVWLARAYLKVGKNAEALEVAKKALATKYVSASVHDVASKAYAANGDTANADAEREKCFAINPWYQDTLHSH